MYEVWVLIDKWMCWTKAMTLDQAKYIEMDLRAQGCEQIAIKAL